MSTNLPTQGKSHDMIRENKVTESINGVFHDDLTYEEQKHILKVLVKRTCGVNHSDKTRLKLINDVFTFILRYPGLSTAHKPREETLLHVRAINVLFTELGKHISLLFGKSRENSCPDLYAQFCTMYGNSDAFFSIEDVKSVEFDITYIDSSSWENDDSKDTATVHDMVTRDLSTADSLKRRAEKIKSCLTGCIYTDLVYDDQKYLLETLVQRVIDSAELPDLEIARHMDILFKFSLAFAQPEQTFDEAMLHLVAVRTALKSQEVFRTWLSEDASLTSCAKSLGHGPHFEWGGTWSEKYNKYDISNTDVKTAMDSIKLYTSTTY